MLNQSKDFTELEVWKKSRLLGISIFKICDKFPKEEKYRLVDQLIRSSRSISANLAEGHGRYHFQENIQFCRIARGSTSETLNHLVCSKDCNLINDEEFLILKKQIIEIRKMLNGYINHLKKQKVAK